MKFSVAASSLLLLNLVLASPLLLEPTHPPSLAARDPQGPGPNNHNCQAPNGGCRLKERDPEPQGPGPNNHNCQAPNGGC